MSQHYRIQWPENVDYIPADWFNSERRFFDKHLMTGVKGGELSHAFCSVLVSKKHADLDYGKVHMRENDRYNVWPGITRIEFQSSKRDAVRRVLWRDNSGKPFAEVNGSSCSKCVWDPVTEAAREGERIDRKIKVAKRVARARQYRLVAAAHPLKCEACNQDLVSAYGKYAYDAAEVHHRRDLALGVVNTRPADLAVLCASCHSVLTRAKVSFRGFVQHMKAASAKKA